MKQLTIEDVRYWNPCYDPTEIPGITEDWTGTILDILKNSAVPAKDRHWAAFQYHNGIPNSAYYDLIAYWMRQTVDTLIGYDFAAEEKVPYLYTAITLLYERNKDETATEKLLRIRTIIRNESYANDQLSPLLLKIYKLMNDAITATLFCVNVYKRVEPILFNTKWLLFKEQDVKLNHEAMILPLVQLLEGVPLEELDDIDSRPFWLPGAKQK